MKKILLVDDENSIREVFAEVLREEGYDVSAVENGVQGLEALGKNTFDLILVDKKMPGIDGLDFIRQVRERKLPTKIVLISGSISEHPMREVDAYLSKPCEIDQLLETVKKMLA
jgi:CheY-like chemotaxis protein